MNEARGQKQTPWGMSNPNEPLFIAESSAMLELKSLAARASGGDAKVLITGESGVGKDVIARFIHARSSRSQRAFVAVNCAAFSETLLVKGGAKLDHDGGGTLDHLAAGRSV